MNPLDLLMDVLLRHGFENVTREPDGRALVVRDGETTARIESVAEVYDFLDRRF